MRAAGRCILRVSWRSRVVTLLDAMERVSPGSVSDKVDWRLNDDSFDDALELVDLEDPEEEEPEGEDWWVSKKRWLCE